MLHVKSTLEDNITLINTMLSENEKDVNILFQHCSARTKDRLQSLLSRTSTTANQTLHCIQMSLQLIQHLENVIFKTDFNNFAPINSYSNESFDLKSLHDTSSNGRTTPTTDLRSSRIYAVHSRSSDNLNNLNLKNDLVVSSSGGKFNKSTPRIITKHYHDEKTRATFKLAGISIVPGSDEDVSDIIVEDSEFQNNSENDHITLANANYQTPLKVNDNTRIDSPKTEINEVNDISVISVVEVKDEIVTILKKKESLNTSHDAINSTSSTSSIKSVKRRHTSRERNDSKIESENKRKSVPTLFSNSLPPNNIPKTTVRTNSESYTSIRDRSHSAKKVSNSKDKKQSLSKLFLPPLSNHNTPNKTSSSAHDDHPSTPIVDDRFELLSERTPGSIKEKKKKRPIIPNRSPSTNTMTSNKLTPNTEKYKAKEKRLSLRIPNPKSFKRKFYNELGPQSPTEKTQSHVHFAKQETPSSSKTIPEEDQKSSKEQLLQRHKSSQSPYAGRTRALSTLSLPNQNIRKRLINTPLIIPNTYASLIFDEPVADENSNYILNIVEDLYQTTYSVKDHVNFIMEDNNEDHFIICVQENPFDSNNQHKALRISKRGHEEMTITLEGDKEISFVKKAKVALLKCEGPRNIISVTSRKFSQALLQLEIKHPQNRTTMKIAIIYCKKDQVDPRHMLQNDNCSKSFWNFVKLLGNEIDLSGWQGYKGDMGNEGKTYYTNFKQIDVIYHIAPLMGAEEHRRLIGNDVAVIFFLDEGQFDPSEIHQLGTMPQLYAVVQPGENDTFKIAVFYSLNIKPFGPTLPKDPLTSHDTKEFLLTKLYNGLMMTTYCPPLNRLYYMPRRDTLEVIVDKFVNETKKDRKAREKQEKRESVIFDNEMSPNLEKKGKSKEKKN